MLSKLLENQGIQIGSKKIKNYERSLNLDMKINGLSIQEMPIKDQVKYIMNFQPACNSRSVTMLIITF